MREASVPPRCPLHVSVAMIMLAARKRWHRDAGRWKRGIAFRELEAMDAELVRGINWKCPVEGCRKVMVTYELGNGDRSL